ncbi:MAG: YoaK family protein [Xanthobacteraceae bacterium]
MSEVHSHREQPLPAAMPMLLSFVAGYVDSYTYLALFGLFAAQVTGSFVIAGAELVTHDYGIAGKLLAIVAFLFAAALTTALVGLARDADRATLPLMLALEALLLAVFAAIILTGPPIKDARDWHGIVAGLFAAMAMGAQSVLVRLLMKGIPQTNVMTGNMTQVGIETTELILAWRRFARSRHGATAVNEFHDVRKRLFLVLSVAIGFFTGAAAGAIAFAVIGLRGALAAVAIVVALALWALYRERAQR